MSHDMQFAEFAVRRVHTSKSIRFCRTEKRVVKRQVKRKFTEPPVNLMQSRYA